MVSVINITATKTQEVEPGSHDARSRCATSGESEGIPKWFFGQVVFWRPGVPRPQNHDFTKKSVVFWPWYTGPPKTTWPKKTLRDPSERVISWGRLGGRRLGGSQSLGGPHRRPGDVQRRRPRRKSRGHSILKGRPADMARYRKIYFGAKCWLPGPKF